MRGSRIHVAYDTDNPDVWTLDRPYERQTALGPIVVPQGFVTDLASTPHTVWLRYPRWGRWSGAAIIHDWLYRMQPNGVTRQQADNIFRELMRADKVRVRDVKHIYWAVDEFGGAAWRKNRRQKQSQSPEVKVA